MTCPYCKSEQEYVPPAAIRCLMDYQKSYLVATLCCRKPIRISPSFSYDVSTVATELLEDDWGTEFNQEDPLASIKELFKNYTRSDINEELISKIRATLDQLGVPHLYPNILDFICDNVVEGD